MLIKSPQCPLSLYSCSHFCSGGYSTAFGIIEAQIFYVDSVKMYLRMLLRYGMRNHNTIIDTAVRIYVASVLCIFKSNKTLMLELLIENSGMRNIVF